MHFISTGLSFYNTITLVFGTNRNIYRHFDLSPSINEEIECRLLYIGCGQAVCFLQIVISSHFRFSATIYRMERRLTYVCIDICMYECMYVCMYVCMYAFMYIPINTYMMHSTDFKEWTL